MKLSNLHSFVYRKVCSCSRIPYKMELYCYTSEGTVDCKSMYFIYRCLYNQVTMTAFLKLLNNCTLRYFALRFGLLFP